LAGQPGRKNHEVTNLRHMPAELLSLLSGRVGALLALLLFLGGLRFVGVSLSERDGRAATQQREAEHQAHEFLHLTVSPKDIGGSGPRYLMIAAADEDCLKPRLKLAHYPVRKRGTRCMPPSRSPARAARGAGWAKLREKKHQQRQAAPRAHQRAARQMACARRENVPPEERTRIMTEIDAGACVPKSKRRCFLEAHQFGLGHGIL
jgi:hypothetical protein